jgi:tRNA modification GTPase
MADTAGLTDSQDALEKAGVILTTNLLTQADLVILVSDATKPADAKKNELICVKRQLRVRNKADLCPALESTSGILNTSAKTGEGIESLLNAIIRTLVPHQPVPGVAVPFTHSQRAALDCARSALAAGDVAVAHGHLQALLSASASS